MSELTLDIERVVRQVLAELGAAPPATSSSTPSSTPIAALTEKPAPTTSPNQLVVDARVVTLADVEHRLKGIRQLAVPPRAVVTPAVRDELDRRRIKLVHASEKADSPLKESRLVMMATGTRFDPEPLRSAVEREGIAIDVRRSNCLMAATDELAEELIGQDRLGLLLTTHPAAGLCLANRHASLRAVSGCDPTRLGDDIASIGANLLVVNSRSSGLFQIKQMTVRFCRETTGQCPDIFRKRLT